MQNRIAWGLGSLTIVAGLVAAGVWISGYLDNPQRDTRSRDVAASANAPDSDPLAPRLFDKSTPIRVHVAGAVRKPNVYSLPNWARVVDALKKAGGPTPNADLDAINLADPLKDGEQVRFPRKGRAEPLQAHLPTPDPRPIPGSVGGHALGRYPFARVTSRAAEGAAEGASGPDGPDHGSVVASSGAKASAEGPSGPVSLNHATQAELEALPGIGPKTAASIIAYREEHGPFLQPQDLMNVKGIGPARFEKLRALIVIP